MSPTYAATTDVSSDRSRSEIERTLRRYGAESFAYGWEGNRAMVGFIVNGRRVQFLLPLPDPNDKAFTLTPARRTQRTKPQAEAAYEQAVKQRWRALNLVIKAKLEAVEAGIVTFEQEFAMHMILPNGQRAGDVVTMAIDKAYETGTVIPLLGITAEAHS